MRTAQKKNIIMKKIDIFNHTAKSIIIKKMHQNLYRKEEVEVPQEINQTEYKTNHKGRKNKVN